MVVWENSCRFSGSEILRSSYSYPLIIWASSSWPRPWCLRTRKKQFDILMLTGWSDYLRIMDFCMHQCVAPTCDFTVPSVHFFEMCLQMCWHFVSAHRCLKCSCWTTGLWIKKQVTARWSQERQKTTKKRGWNAVVFNQLWSEEIQMCCTEMWQVMIVIRQKSCS